MPIVYYRRMHVKDRRVLSESDVHGEKIVMLPGYSLSCLVKQVEIEPDGIVRITIKELNGKETTKIFSGDGINRSTLCEVIGLEYYPKQNDPFRVRHH